MSTLSEWWDRWIGHSADDRRNFGWRITEALRVKVEWARVIFDLRIGFKRGGKWRVLYLRFWTPVTQNFWNGILTVNVYVVKTTLWKIPVLIPRINLVSRFARTWWFQAGIGYLFDRGEFGAKIVIANWENEEKFNPGVNAIGWEEGSV